MYYYKQTIDGNTFYFKIEEEEQSAYNGATQVTKEEYDAYMEEQRKIAEALKNRRYYYKKGNSYLNLKSPISGDGYEEITESAFKEATKPIIPQLTEAQEAKIEKKKQIAGLKKKLTDTDYIVLKIAEAVADNDTAEVTALKTEYATELIQRQAWRSQINELEAQIQNG